MVVVVLVVVVVVEPPEGLVPHERHQGLVAEARAGQPVEDLWVLRDVVLQDAGFQTTSFKPLTHISFRCEVPTPSCS